MRKRQFLVQSNRVLEHLCCPLHILLRSATEEPPTAQVVVVRFRAVDTLACNRLLLLRRQLDVQRLSNRVGDLILKEKRILHFVIVSFSPNGVTAGTFDQLRTDTNTRTGMAKTAGKNV